MMKFESFIGRRQLWVRERRAETFGEFAWILVRRLVLINFGLVILAALVEGAIRLFGWPGLLQSGRDAVVALQGLGALNAVIALLVFLHWLIGIRLTTLISISSVAIGVGALIVVIALLDGIDASFHRKYMDLSGHIEVLPPLGARDDLLTDPEHMTETLRADPRVIALAPEITREAFLLPDRELSGRKTAVQLLGVDPASMRDVAGFVERTVRGTGDPGPDEIVLGQLLAHELFVQPGDSVWVITRIAIGGFGTPHFRRVELRVAGLFVTGIPELDMATAYVNLDTMRRAFVLPEDGTGSIVLRVEDPYRARETAAAIAAAHPDLDVRWRPWDETNAEFFHALRLEKVGTFIMLLMIILVASFNIIGTLVMIVTERTRDIGILKTVGAADAEIRHIFLRSGLLIGGIGTSIGLTLGLAICFAISRMPLQLPAMLYDIDRLPVLIHWQTVLLIVAASMAICLFASVIPAQTAARMNPVDALRHE